MATTHYDVIINGTKAKVSQYTRRSVRREITENILVQAQIPVFASRDDRRQTYQTSWAGGATWWKPNISLGSEDTFLTSNHMDTWSEPGKVVPANKVSDAANANIHNNCVIGVGAAGIVYAIGESNTTNATYKDVYAWTPGSDAFVRDSGVHSGIADAAGPMAMVYDPADSKFYVITDDDDIERFDPVGNSQDADWITAGFTSYLGANIFLQNQTLMFYSGDQLYTVDKTEPDVTSVFNDGMGPDFLSDIAFAGSPLFLEANPQLAVSTPEGIYYCKNTRQGGQPQPWVFRVDKDAAGNWIGNPIATLPVGSVALSVAWHLGQLIVSTSPDWQAVVDNDTKEAEVVLYFVSIEGGMGALGSVLGGRTRLDETPFALLGSDGPYLYIGGHKRLWVYDAVRGGLHIAFEWGTELANGPYVSMAWVADSSGNTNMLFLGADRIALQITTKNDDPDTVAAFGDDEAHYTLESNYFDAGLPMELKELTAVSLLRDPGDGDQEWTVQVSADDGAYADALVHSTTSEVQASAALSGTTGYVFSYKIIYQTKDTNREALRALLFTFTTGEMIAEWDLVLDGTEMLNIDNETQDPEAFYDSLITLSGKDGIITLVDNYQEHEQETDSATTTKVKVVAVEINKDTPGEAEVRVILRET